MPLIKMKFLVTLALALLVSACATMPSHLIVAPDVLVTPHLQYNDKQTQLEVIDMRTANHIVQILQEGEAATLISAQERLEKIITQTLTEQWQKQGLTVIPLATNTISITIEKAVISVTQQAVNYQSQTEIVLKVSVNNGQQTLTSTFKNRGNSKGPLQADIAVLERNFNRRLASLITQILANEKINNFIK
ncbi:MAG: YajG family lipoprotein [Colwellia sp.]|nr:YajG family lipoprotein [Colwellia sp.]MCW8864424.1 YajG family lipoprotein [Colwellia sp.]MCW9080837.1 YajG family lipoprotein [Colwellia sp.]